MLMVHQSAASPREWSRPRHGYSLRDNKRQESSVGFAPTVRKNGKDFQIHIKAPFSSSKTSSCVAQRSSQEQMARGKPCKKTERHLVPSRACSSFLLAFDTANAKIGAGRNQQNTEVHGNITLGVAVGPRRCNADQL